MELAVATSEGKERIIEVSDSAFGREYNRDLVHQTVVAYLAGRRQGTSAQKNRSSVSGGGRKPFRQKGTGRARAGTTRSPLWRSGGVTFAGQPRNFSKKLNRKMYRAALSSILSELARQDRLLVVDNFDIETPRTKALLEKLAEFRLLDALIINEPLDENLYLSSRNVKGVVVCNVAGVNPVSLINSPKIIMTVPALRKIEEVLS